MLKLTIKKASVTTVDISEIQEPPLPMFDGAEQYMMKSLEIAGNAPNMAVGKQVYDKRRVLLALEGYQRFRSLPVERGLILSV